MPYIINEEECGNEETFYLLSMILDIVSVREVVEIEKKTKQFNT